MTGQELLTTPPQLEVMPDHHAVAWAEYLGSALDNELAGAMAINSPEAFSVLMTVVDELRRLSVENSAVRPVLAKVLRQLHQAVSCDDFVAEMLNELRALAQANGDDGDVTTQLAMALAVQVEDLVRSFEIEAAVALLSELRFEHRQYAETSDSVDARVRALAAVYRALRSPELIAEMHSLACSGSYVSLARLGHVLTESKDPECANIFAALTNELERAGAGGAP